MTKDEGHVHKSNGTVFAVDDSGLVYVTCSTGSGSHKITENNSQCIKVVNMYSRVGEDGKPQPVESVRGKCVHWVMLDEESMGLLVNKGQSSCCYASLVAVSVNYYFSNYLKYAA